MSASPLEVPRRLVFTARQEVSVDEFDPGAPGEDQVRVRTALSLMSTGTENIVFNRLFDAGTHWDNWVKYPFYPGYTCVGTVETVGSGVHAFKPGDRVAYRVGHRSHAVVAASACIPIPAGLPFEKAVWFSLAKITFIGIQAGNCRLGDEILVIGAGPIGQMALRWARALGAASILCVDTAANRMPLARAGGATATISAPIGEARDAILSADEGRLPRVVIDSTGNSFVFAQALGLVRDRGTVVVLGDTGAPTEQALTSDVITRGITIVGAHDSHNSPQWDGYTIPRLFFKLAVDGRFPLEGLTSHVFAPEDCAKAYATANTDRANTMGILFDWSGELRE